LGRPLLHLDPAGATFGGADLDVVVPEPIHEPAPGAERGPEVVAFQAEGPRHPRAAAVDELDVELGDLANQVEAGHPEVERAEVARLVVADPRPQRVPR